jgi:hypothetical protein
MAECKYQHIMNCKCGKYKITSFDYNCLKSKLEEITKEKNKLAKHYAKSIGLVKEKGAE